MRIGGEVRREIALALALAFAICMLWIFGMRFLFVSTHFRKQCAGWRVKRVRACSSLLRRLSWSCKACSGKCLLPNNKLKYLLFYLPSSGNTTKPPSYSHL